MVTDTEGYVHVIEYLTEHLSLFESLDEMPMADETIMEVIEQELSDQIINLCNQHQSLSFNQRNMIVREIDSIVYDLQEILSGVVNNQVTERQFAFIKEFSTLIKNLFDTEIHDLP